MWEIFEYHLETITIREFFCTLLLQRLGLFKSADKSQVRNNDE